MKITIIEDVPLYDEYSKNVESKVHVTVTLADETKVSNTFIFREDNIIASTYQFPNAHAFNEEAWDKNSIVARAVAMFIDTKLSDRVEYDILPLISQDNERTFQIYDI